MQFTYDRPELANKVILRRHSSTGMWEVCSPNKNSHPKNITENCSESLTLDCDSEVSVCADHAQEQHHSDLQTRGRHKLWVANRVETEKDSGVLNLANTANPSIRRRSPRSLQSPKQDQFLNSRTHKAVNKEKSINPQHVSMLEVTSNDGVCVVKRSLISKQKSIDKDFKSPRLCLSPALPCTYKISKSHYSSDNVRPNELLDCSTNKLQSDDCIGSRTRQRVTAEVQSNNQMNSTVTFVHSNESSSTISHKYPTRHKMTGQP